MAQLRSVLQYEGRCTPHPVALPPESCFLYHGRSRFAASGILVKSLTIQPGLLGDLAQDIPATDIAPLREKRMPHP